MRKNSGIKLAVLALAGLGMFAAQAADAPMAAPAASSFTANVGGLLQVDQTTYFNDKVYGPKFEDGLEVRRATLKVFGNVTEDWSYYAELRNTVPTRGTQGTPAGVNGTPATSGASNVGTNVLGANTIYAAYSFGGGSISIGNQFPIFGYEVSRAARSQNFLEDSMPAQFFGTMNNLGVNIAGNTDNVTYGLSGYMLPRIFVTCSITAASTATSQLGNIGGSARLTLSPSSKNIHIGVSGLYEAYTSEYAGYSLFGLETNLGFKGLQTQSLRWQPSAVAATNTYKLSSMYQLSAEAAGVMGMISGFVEGHYASIGNTSTAPSTALKADALWGLNSELSIMVTGEAKNYDRTQARITGVTPNGEYGAWEVGARANYINLLSANVAIATDFDSAGTFSSWTTTSVAAITAAQFSSYSFAGLIAWHANSNFSVRANIVWTALPTSVTSSTPAAVNVAGSPTDILATSNNLVGVGLRAQIAW